MNGWERVLIVVWSSLRLVGEFQLGRSHWDLMSLDCLAIINREYNC